MRFHRRFAVLIFAIFSSSLVQAGEYKKDPNPPPSPKITDVFKSTLNQPALNVWFYSSPLLAGLIAFREDTVSHNQQEIAEEKSLGRTSKYGDYAGRVYPNLAYMGAMGLHGYFSDESSYTNMKAMFWATTASAAVAQILKDTVRERRPNNPESRQSFPSGHTTTAFAFASVVQEFHGWEWGGPAYALATFVGFSRMNDNKHYLHDVVFGALLGATYGIGVSNLYQKPKTEHALNHFMILPSEDGEGALVSSVWAI